MRSIRGGGFWILAAVLVGGLTWVLQSGPFRSGEQASTEQAKAPQQDELAPPATTPPATTPPATTQPASTPDGSRPATSPTRDGMLELHVSDLETRTLVVLADKSSPVERETVFQELKSRHALHPLDVAHLLPLAALRGDEARRDDVRAIGDWARRQIESHKDREILVEPILTLWFEHREGPRGALLDVLDDLGHMRPRNIEAARAAFVDKRASYRLKRSILFLLPSVAEHAIPMVVPLAFFRDEVVGGEAQVLGPQEQKVRIIRREGKSEILIRMGSKRPNYRGGFQREHLEGQIDALFEQMGAPALHEMVRAVRQFFADPKRSGRASAGWTIYDEAIIELAHLDVDLILTMSLAMSHHERRLAAQALRELEVKSPDVERALDKLRRDPDRLVREFAKGS